MIYLYQIKEVIQMNYLVYGNQYGKEDLLVVGQAKNKKTMREIILSHKLMQIISRVQYGRKSYSMSDIYAGR
jgi:hypothetical protein